MESPSGYGWNEAAPESCGYLTPAVLAALRRLGPKKVLDLGAGNGHMCAALVASGYQTIAVEPDEQGFKQIVDRCPQAVAFRLAVSESAAPIVKTAGRVDAVLSTEVIEHLYGPHLLLRFASEVLNDDGFLILTTPYHGYLKNLAISVFNGWDRHWTPLWHGGHIKFWSRKSLGQLLEQGGFRVVSFSGVGRFPYLWKSMLVVARKSTQKIT